MRHLPSAPTFVIGYPIPRKVYGTVDSLRTLVIASALIVALLALPQSFAQEKKATKSPHASVTQRIGTGDVTIDYSRPRVNGRVIWGDIVPYNNGIPYPWRAGANDTTTIEFEQDVLIQGQPLPAGKYGIHMVPAAEGEWTIIFNKAWEGHGSFEYDEAQDALRVKAVPEEAPHEEWLRYGFDELAADSARAYLHWEKKKAGFTISLPKPAE